MSHASRRTLLASALSLPFAPRAGAQQAWPAGQTLKITVPFAPGGSVDAIARLTQPGLQQRLGVNVIVENRAGAGGATGATVVAKSHADGSNWLYVFDSHAVLPSLMELSFDAKKDLDPVMLIGTAPMVVACHPSRPWKSFGDVIAAAKAKPDTITYGSVGNGSLGHLSMILLGKKGGFLTRHVPYRGGGPAITDAVGGHIDLIIGSAALLTAQIEGGGLRPLLQTGAQRLKNLGQTQTAKEAGFPDFEALAWWGVFAPAGTPKPVEARMLAELDATFHDPQVAKVLVETQQITLLLRGPEDFRKFFEEQMTVWGAVVRENDIKPD